MHYPSKEEFIKLAKKGNLVPVYRDILADFETPLSAYAKIDNNDYSFLLESVEGGERLARYSMLGSRPSLVFTAKGRRITLQENNVAKTFEAEDPVEEMKKVLARYRPVTVKGLPRFFGGFVGYLGYDMVRFMEKIPDKNPDDLNVADAVFMLADTLLIFDHVDRKIKVISNSFIGDDAARAYDEAVEKIEEIIRLVRAPLPNEAYLCPVESTPEPVKMRSNLTKEAFEDAVSKAKVYIKKGDIIQTVLSQRLEIPIKSHPFQVYRALRSINPSPYMYCLKLKDFHLVGSSPEIMVRCEEGKVEVRPIAGTRPRGASDSEDEKLIKDLLSDPKERAEHIMLVDLGRNDIGRVCDYRTVKVSELMTIEKYSHVMHIVTDVSGRLKKGKDMFDVIRATFPAGTVTGAPKIRAMEIIDELENVKRATYAGCVGYFSFSGNLDTCITIRTIQIKDGMAYIQAGAGIVADSRPAREYQETLNKAKALIRAVEMAEGGLE